MNRAQALKGILDGYRPRVLGNIHNITELRNELIAVLSLAFHLKNLMIKEIDVYVKEFVRFIPTEKLVRERRAKLAIMLRELADFNIIEDQILQLKNLLDLFINQ
jgi:hypothetical protein